MQTITLGSDADIVRNGAKQARADAVVLSTLHAAKGLEFPVVVICGASEGLLPLRDAQGECADIEEERRLLYVGITRARAELIITSAAQRNVYGETKRCVPSGFIGDINSSLIVRETWRPEPRVEQMRLL
jgi:DNA helicase-2/ATP-dependent DNA helicase PcrA